MLLYIICFTGAPVAPKGVKVKDITNSSVTITWLAEYDWGSPQQFRIDINTTSAWTSAGSMVPASNLQEYSQKVTGLTSNQIYRIRVKACNKVKGCNKDRFDSVQTFTTKGRVTLTFVIISSDCSFSCLRKQLLRIPFTRLMVSHDIGDWLEHFRCFTLG